MKHSIFHGSLASTLVLIAVLTCSADLAKADTVGERRSSDATARLGFQSIVGSWKLVDNQTGDVFFGTYSGGPFQGVVNFTSPDNGVSLTHGAWKRTGPRTFVDTDSGFIYDETGVASLVITFRAEIEVNPDGETALFDFEFEVAQFDGVVVDSGASTATGTRIKVRR